MYVGLIAVHPAGNPSQPPHRVLCRPSGTEGVEAGGEKSVVPAEEKMREQLQGRVLVVRVRVDRALFFGADLAYNAFFRQRKNAARIDRIADGQITRPVDEAAQLLQV